MKGWRSFWENAEPAWVHCVISSFVFVQSKRHSPPQNFHDKMSHIPHTYMWVLSHTISAAIAYILCYGVLNVICLLFTLLEVWSEMTLWFNIFNILNILQVHFDAGTPLSSSPSNNSNNLNMPTSPQYGADNSKHMYMNTSFATIDIQASPTSFYRPAVDRLLR